MEALIVDYLPDSLKDNRPTLQRLAQSLLPDGFHPTTAPNPGPPCAFSRLPCRKLINQTTALGCREARKLSSLKSTGIAYGQRRWILTN